MPLRIYPGLSNVMAAALVRQMSLMKTMHWCVVVWPSDFKFDVCEYILNPKPINQAKAKGSEPQSLKFSYFTAGMHPAPDRCQVKIDQRGLFPESQGRNLAVTVLYVPYSQVLLLQCGYSSPVQAPREPSACQIAFLNFLVCTGARQNPGTCDTNQGDLQRRFVPPLRAVDRLPQVVSLDCECAFLPPLGGLRPCHQMSTCLAQLT